MGNVTLCGTLCDSALGINNEEKESKTNIDQILIKEIFEREQLHKTIDREVQKIKSTVDLTFQTLKEYCENQKNLVQLDLNNTKEITNQSIKEIQKDVNKIRDEHLYIIEKQIVRVESEIGNLREDIHEIKHNIKELTINMTKVITQVEIIKNK